MQRPLPDWCLVGAPKCGTTSLMAWLGEHPDLFVSAVKEPNWFNGDVSYFRRVHDEDAYRALFAGADDRPAGEGSTTYLFSPGAAARLHAANPACRIMAAFRDPVEVAPALHAQLLWEGFEPEPDFARAWAADEPGRLPSGVTYRGVLAFGTQWQRYLDAFGKAACHAVWLDDLRCDAPGTFAGVLRHLGVDEQFRPSYRVVNERKDIRSLAWHRLLTRVGRLAPGPQDPGIIYRLKHRNSCRAPRRPLPADLAADIRDTMAPEMRRLAAATGRDLSHWLPTKT